MELEEIGQFIAKELGASLLSDDENSWNMCLSSFPHNKYVPVQYKPSFIRYQAEYFSSVYKNYKDCSMVVRRGGVPVGIWPVCLYYRNNQVEIGSNGGALIEPLFSNLPKAEAQRNIIQQIFNMLCSVKKESSIPFSENCITCVNVMDEGTSQWQRKWMEAGAVCTKVGWWTYADLFLTREEIQSKIRRTNRYSIEKAAQEYDIRISDSRDDIFEVFDEFRLLHCKVSGRMTRSKSTWDIQRDSIMSNSDLVGWDFVVSLRDKISNEIAGMALFVSTPQSAYYTVAAYDRKRFDKPIGHAAQATAMEYMKSKGIRWYEIGERSYPSDTDVNEKLINIGKYKEGFATHIFPKITLLARMDQLI